MKKQKKHLKDSSTEYPLTTNEYNSYYTNTIYMGSEA